MGVFQVGVILGGNFPSGNCPSGSYPGCELSRWELSWMEIFFGGSFPGGNCPRGIIRVGVFLVPCLYTLILPHNSISVVRDISLCYVINVLSLYQIYCHF